MRLRKIRKIEQLMRGKLKKTSAQGNTIYYDTEYANDFPLGNYFVSKFGSLPSYFHCGNSQYNVKVSDYFLNSDEYSLIWESKKIVKGEICTASYIFESDDLLVQIKNKISSNDSSPSNWGFEETPDASPDYAIIEIYYNSSDPLDNIVQNLSRYYKDKKSKSKISLVISNRSGLSTMEQTIKETNIDIPLNYGKDFVKVHNKIVEKLNENKGKGIVLLHGVPGTGKTNYIRHLCGLLNKEIIFIPPFLAETISSPDFITFLLEHTNSILVIEDAEKIVLDRESDASNRQSVSNLLNVTDGILSDCLSIQIIATFNTSRDRIDKALLRKGRLIAEWKFDPLSVDDSNKLLESLGREDKATSPMTLTDIYNMEEEVNVVQQERRTIGFAR